MSINEFLTSFELGLIYGIVAMGIYLTFKIIDFPDLTCDGSFVLGAASSSILIQNGCNPILSLIVAMFAGALAGLATGILNRYLKISNLLSGILIGFMLYSINLHVLGGVPNIALITETTIFTNHNPLIILIAVSILIWLSASYILNTDFGLAIRSIGQNPRLAQNNGVSITLMTIVTLGFSNALIALGGGLFSQHQGFVDVSQGVGTVIIGLAAVTLGEKILSYRATWVALLACIAGSIIYRLFISIALHSEILGLETQDLNLITGLLLIIVLILPRRKRC